MKKAFNIIFVILAACIIAAPMIFINREPDKISARENRYLTNFPTADISDPEFRSQFTGWLNDNIGFRDEFLDMRTSILFDGLNVVTSPKVHRGIDGWYFYTLDNNLELSTGEYPLSDEDIDDILKQQLAIRDKLAERGTEYVLVLPASKATIYPEYVGYSDGEIVSKTAVDRVADYIQANSDIRVVRLKDALLKDKAENNKQLYFKTDTHWNEYGAYVIYKEINRMLNEWGLIDSGLPDVSFVDGEYAGEFSTMLGCPGLLDSEPTTNTQINDPSAVRDMTSQAYSDLQSIHDTLGLRTPVYHFTNDAVQQKKALIFGDSLFGNWNFNELMAENFSELTYVWDTSVYQEFVDYTDPDIVICEIGERYLNVLSTKSQKFITDPLGDYNAEIVLTKLVTDGIEVRVRNNSSSTWTAKDFIKCGLFCQGEDTGIRAEISGDVQVAPGDEYTFLLPFTADTADIGQYEVQMLQEGITYFGQKAGIPYDSSSMINDAEIVSDTAPTSVNHTDSYSIDITVRNTGTTTWNAADNYRLCIFQDGGDWGYRLDIPDGVTVAPGDEYTFTLNGFVLPEAQQTTLEFQMLIEGVCYFGEKKPAVITSAD